MSLAAYILLIMKAHTNGMASVQSSTAMGRYMLTGSGCGLGIGIRIVVQCASVQVLFILIPLGIEIVLLLTQKQLMYDKRKENG